MVLDAECVLCGADAKFILKHDRRRRFRLASMQGQAGASIYRELGIDPTDPETMVVVDGERVWRDSDGVLAIYRGLGWPWKALGVFGLVPRAIRDPIYGWIARNRYRLFGKRDTCWVPAPAEAHRILP